MWIYTSMQLQYPELSHHKIYITLHVQRTNIKLVQQLSIPLYHNYAGQYPLTLGYIIHTKFQEFSLLVYTYLRLTWCFYM
jgi:hypothetical protein